MKFLQKLEKIVVAIQTSKGMKYAIYALMAFVAACLFGLGWNLVTIGI